MSKETALARLSETAINNMLADIPVAKSLHGHADKEAVVRAYQQEMGLTPDGWPGDKTLACLWREWRPSPNEIAKAAEHALNEWGRVKYTQGKDGDFGEGWFEDHTGSAGDCSDFASHCLGIPKMQRQEWGALVVGWPTDPQWLGAANIASGCIGRARPWHEARVGDLIAYGGDGAHVEVVVNVSLGGAHGVRIMTIGCSDSSFKKFKTAVARRDRTSLWAMKKAVAVTPWWNEVAR